MDGDNRWRAVGVATFVVAGFLLLSMGGAIVAAPVTVPLMFVAAARHSTSGFRRAALVLSALTVAEVGWAATYLLNGERQPWVWLVPCLAALAILVTSRRLSRSRLASG